MFKFEIIKSDNFEQMKISRIEVDNNREVRTFTCEDCNISQTNAKVDDLVKSVSKEFKIQEWEVLAAKKGVKELIHFCLIDLTDILYFSTSYY